MNRTFTALNGSLCINDDGVVIQVADRTENLAYREIKNVSADVGNIDFTIIGKKGIRLKFPDSETDTVAWVRNYINTMSKTEKSPTIIKEVTKIVDVSTSDRGSNGKYTVISVLLFIAATVFFLIGFSNVKSFSPSDYGLGSILDSSYEYITAGPISTSFFVLGVGFMLAGLLVLVLKKMDEHKQ